MSDKISLKDAQAEINGLLVAEICRDFGINFRDVYPEHILRGVGPEQAFIGLAIKRGHLALPAVQPRVKPLEWERGIVDWAKPLPGMKYVACSTIPAGSWAWWLDGAEETRSVEPDEESAKAAAQADYEARILSALDNNPRKEVKSE